MRLSSFPAQPLPSRREAWPPLPGASSKKLLDTPSCPRNPACAYRPDPYLSAAADDKKSSQSQVVTEALYGCRRSRSKSGRGRTAWLLSLKARALLAAVNLTAARQRNLFHSKWCVNGTANSATTCRWQVAAVRQRQDQQGPDARSSSQAATQQ